MVTTIPYSELLLCLIINILHFMHANMYNIHGYDADIIKSSCVKLLNRRGGTVVHSMLDHEQTDVKQIQHLVLCMNITHVSKHHSNNIDIYSDYICKKNKWHIESWIRSDRINNKKDNVIDVSAIKYEHFAYNESQDHSKFGVCIDTDEVCFGDLNRMNSQYHRGGGAFVFKDPFIATFLRQIIKG